MLKLDKALWLVACSLAAVWTLSGQVILKDHPTKGEWRFSPEKIWEVEKAGQEEFGRIAELLITDHNGVFLRDFERNVSYIFDANDGRFIRSFAAQGTGEGQMPFYLNRFQAGDKVVLAAPDKLHFFTWEGAFDHAVENNLFLRFPLHFLDENTFIFAPAFPRSPVHEKKLAVYDLSSGRESILVDFTEPAARGQEPAPLPMLMIASLIPQVNLADDGATLFFGRNDEYTIYTADHSGNIQSSFCLDRKKSTASPESKRNHLADSRMPKEVLEKILAQLPGEMTYFHHIQSINGLIFVFAVTTMDKETAIQPIDLFSPKGEYLYRASLGFGDLVKFSSPSNLVIKDKSVYVILENERGKRHLAKYKINLPR